MVANTECQFRKEFYSVSTKIVCEVGHGSMEKTGEIQVNINGQHGTSTNEVQFTYQVSVYAGYVLCICVYVYMCMKNLIPFLFTGYLICYWGTLKIISKENQ
uniref:IPT/TIG domain-containing protein n=1 Tax=Micrurus paraensis TaxID=1970185 RepID=A0A2D4KZ59_9SAUR